jgi:hypothetical protein
MQWEDLCIDGEITEIPYSVNSILKKMLNFHNFLEVILDFYNSMLCLTTFLPIFFHYTSRTSLIIHQVNVAS